jgi:hypothetical protein
MIWPHSTCGHARPRERFRFLEATRETSELRLPIQSEEQ